MLQATISFLPSITSEETITPLRVITSFGSSNSSLSWAGLFVKNWESPKSIIFAPEKDKLRTIQWRGTFWIKTIASSRTSPSLRLEFSLIKILSSRRRTAFVFASRRRPTASIKSSGGRWLNAIVITASSDEFIYGTIFVTCPATKKLIKSFSDSRKQKRKFMPEVDWSERAWKAPPFAPTIILACKKEVEFMMQGHCPRLHFI